MPGSVIRIAVQVGDDVEAGQPLLWLEAMKMEHTVAATAAGRVEEVRMQVGQQVELGQVLVVVADTEQEVPV
jgi:propionyl-CoA carboxylase alpha chain